MKSRAGSIVVIGLTLAGCNAAPPARQVDLGPTLDRDGRPRSLVMSAPDVVADPAAWYVNRNDYARITAVEPDGLVYDASVRRVHDHLHSSGNRVHDHYHESSYSRRVRVYAP